MPRTRTGSSIKDPKLYERLRVQGNSNEKAARIANAAAVEGRSEVGRRGKEQPSDRGRDPRPGEFDATWRGDQ